MSETWQISRFEFDLEIGARLSSVHPRELMSTKWSAEALAGLEASTPGQRNAIVGTVLNALQLVFQGSPSGAAPPQTAAPRAVMTSAASRANQNRGWKCMRCDETFDTRRGLATHIGRSKNHKDEREERPLKRRKKKSGAAGKQEQSDVAGAQKQHDEQNDRDKRATARSKRQSNAAGADNKPAIALGGGSSSSQSSPSTGVLADTRPARSIGSQQMHIPALKPAEGTEMNIGPCSAGHTASVSEVSRAGTTIDAGFAARSSSPGAVSNASTTVLIKSGQ